ncbi:MAG: c-type cytochrome [Gammaproteobacteria bacterium]|nr:c-type cytochrome [Gammaproteobacteria bacterium]
MSEHEMSDAQFGKIFGAMIVSMVTLTVVLIVLAFIVTQNVNARMAAQREADKTMEINTRTAPVGTLNVGEAGQTAAAGSVSAEPLSGETVYTSSCAACHAAGVAGAPKLGDAGAWSARLAQGNDVLYEHAIKGYQGSAGLMPAKGGNANLSDDEVKAAVDHMVANAK